MSAITVNGVELAAVSMAGMPAAGLGGESKGLGDALEAAQGDEARVTAALAQMFVHEGNDATIKLSGQSAALVAAAPMNSITRTELLLDEAEALLPRLVQPWLFLIPADDTVIPAEAELATARVIPGARTVLRASFAPSSATCQRPDHRFSSRCDVPCVIIAIAFALSNGRT
jgi:hypothetical protein